MPPRADGLRLMRYAIGLLFVAVIALAVLVVVAFSAIQQSRQDSIRSQCQEQNARHDGAIKTLDGLIAKITDPKMAKRAREGRPNTVLLIEALVPRRDCDKRVRVLVK